MEELQLKYVEIAFDKQAPQKVGTEINISGKIDGEIENLEYKFIVGKGGVLEYYTRIFRKKLLHMEA